MSTVRLQGELCLPGDKSISHRALIFSALSSATSQIQGLSPAQDCVSTVKCLRQLGLTVALPGENLVQISSPGVHNLSKPSCPLDAGNSGTTIRLLSGLLAGQKFETVLDGDNSLRRRPMDRVLQPLTKMGAHVRYLEETGFPPFSVMGGDLHGIDYDLPIASAQVATALVLAALQAQGQTRLTVPGSPRDHTQRMLGALGISLQQAGDVLVIDGPQSASQTVTWQIPGDISSAAFFMVAAALLPNSSVLLKNVGLNPGRILVLDVLQRMGARISCKSQRNLNGEPVADVSVCTNGQLQGTTITAEEIARGIDEIPILSLAGALSKGCFVVAGAGELAVKESNRLAAIETNLSKVGALVETKTDSLIITGQDSLAGGCTWETFGDHRLAMTGMIANLVCQEPVQVDDEECVKISYPDFPKDLDKLLA